MFYLSKAITFAGLIVFLGNTAFAWYPCQAIGYARQYVDSPNQFYGSVADETGDDGSNLGDASNFICQVLAAGCKNPCDPNPPAGVDPDGQGGCQVVNCPAGVWSNASICQRPPAWEGHEGQESYNHFVMIGYTDLYSEMTRDPDEGGIGTTYQIGNQTLFSNASQLTLPVAVGSIVVFYDNANGGLSNICSYMIWGPTGLIGRDASLTTNTVSTFIENVPLGTAGQVGSYYMTAGPGSESPFWLRFRIVLIPASAEFDDLGTLFDDAAQYVGQNPPTQQSSLLTIDEE